MAEVKVAYRKVAMDLHPDRNDGCDKKTAMFKQAAEAYEILSDHRKRSQYDAELFGHDRQYHRRATDAIKHTAKSRYKVYAPRPPPGFKRYDFKMWNHMHYGDDLWDEQLDSIRKRQQRIENVQTATGSRQESVSPLGRGFAASTFKAREDRGDSAIRMKEAVVNRMEERRRNRPARKLFEEDGACIMM